MIQVLVRPLIAVAVISVVALSGGAARAANYSAFFSDTISSFNEEKTFRLPVTVAAGDTIVFSVGTRVFNNLSTGLRLG